MNENISWLSGKCKQNMLMNPNKRLRQSECIF